MRRLMRKWILSFSIFFSIAAICCTTIKAQADPADLSETEERAAKVQESLKSCLTPEAYELAQELGLTDHLTRLQYLKEHESHKRGTPPLSQESLSLRLETVEVLLTTALQCQAVVAQIEAETVGNFEIKSALEGRRDNATKTNAIANVVANGFLSSVGNLLQMPFENAPDARSQFPGEITESAGTLMATGLGGLALHQNRGMALSAPIEPNMLAKVFKRPNDSKTEYPDIIWTYLNSAPPGAKKDGPTRRELLIRRWADLGRLPSPATQKGRLYQRVIAGTMPQTRAVTIGMLDDRIAMLADLRAEVNQIYKELLNMMLVVRAL